MEEQEEFLQERSAKRHEDNAIKTSKKILEKKAKQKVRQIIMHIVKTVIMPVVLTISKYVLIILAIVTILASLSLIVSSDEEDSDDSPGQSETSDGQTDGQGGYVGGLHTGTSLDMFLEYLQDAELKNPPTNAEGDKYKVYCDYAGNLAVGVGIDLAAQRYNLPGDLFSIDESGRTYEGYRELEYINEERGSYESHQVKDLNHKKMNKKNTTLEYYNLIDSTMIVYVPDEYPRLRLIDKESKKAILIKKFEVDTRKREIIDGDLFTIESILKEKNIELEEYQIYALVSRYYNMGGANVHTYTFADNYLTYWGDDPESHIKFGGEADFSDGLYVNHMCVPNNDGLTVRRQSEWKLFQTGYYDRIEQYYSAESDESKSEEVNIGGLIRPVSKNINITSSFGPRDINGDGVIDDNHGGTDFGTPIGTEIYATHDGKVVDVVTKWKTNGFYDPSGKAWAGNGGMDSYGNYVIIESNDGTYRTLYAHCHTDNGVVVNIGDTVSQGQVIAYSGHTGNSTSAHLHFELQLASEYGGYNRVNAEEYIGTNKLLEWIKGLFKK